MSDYYENKGVVSMNLNDTIFMFLCTLLVWLMTPGLSLFYGGLVQSKMRLILSCKVWQQLCLLHLYG